MRGLREFVERVCGGRDLLGSFIFLQLAAVFAVECMTGGC